VSILHPGTAADILCFTTSAIGHKLENNPSFLAPGLCLFGDNAYVNAPCMATLFKGIRSGPKDDYNFYHSQVCINIECAFGMLINRWGLLRRAVPAAIGVKKTCRLVKCLATLHNFCIDRRVGVTKCLATDNVEIAAHGGLECESNDFNRESPDQLLHGGEHFDETELETPEQRRNYERRARRANNGVLPRDLLLEVVTEKELKRPPPRQWWKDEETNN